MNYIFSRKDLKFYLNEDRKACGLNGLSVKERLHFRLRVSYLIFKFQKYLRYEEFFYNKGGKINRLLALIIRAKKDRLGCKLGFEIPKNVFGPGLRIVHIGSIIINADCKIGANCTLYNDINIGVHLGKCPILGDNITIYPGAKLFGNIKIADRISIGANSTVTKSFLSEDIKIAGSPAKEIGGNV